MKLSHTVLDWQKGVQIMTMLNCSWTIPRSVIVYVFF